MRAKMTSRSTGFGPRLSLILAMAALVGGTSCGGDDSAASCPTANACGGDVVGTWTIERGCFDSGLIDACPSASVSAAGLRVKGSLTMTAGLTYESTQTVDGVVTLSLPKTCVSGAATCAQIGQSQTLPATFSSLTCTGTTTCECRFVVKPSTDAERGTYTIAGAVLKTTPSVGVESSSRYCVSGNELKLEDPDETISMGSMGSMNLTSYLVLKK